MASTMQPQDRNQDSIPVLAQEAVVNTVSGPVSVEVAIPGQSYPPVVRIYTAQDTYVLFTPSGTPATQATATLLGAGSITDWSVKAGDTHIAVLQSTYGGAVSITSLV